MVAARCWRAILIVPSFIVLFLTPCLSLQVTIRVAGLLEDEHVGPRLALKTAFDEINISNDVLPHGVLAYQMLDVKPHDSFEANKKVCREVKEGVAAVFGPVSHISAGHVQSICNTLYIPHIQAHWDSRDRRDLFSINLYPDYLALSTAYRHLIKSWGWTAFTILYEDNDGLIRLQEVLSAAKGKKMKVTIRKLPTNIGHYRYLFKDLTSNPMEGNNRIIVDCKVENVNFVLMHAKENNMTLENFHYLFTTLDLGLLDLTPYVGNGANITAFRLVDPERPLVKKTQNAWLFDSFNNIETPLQRYEQIPTDVALMYDAAYLFGKALHELLKAQDIETTALSCSRSKTWDQGISLLNYMKAMDFEGLSGRIHYHQGKRTDFELDIIELSPTGIEKIGTWNKRDNVTITKSFQESQKEVLEELSNKTLQVVTVLEKPYASRVPGKDDEYEGFCIDLLKNISNRIGFNFTIRPVDAYSKLVDELIMNKADLAVAGMTITYDREQVIDFTKPFLNLGITILYKKPEPKPPKLFSFLSPLSIDVWVYMLAGYLCISFMLFVIARFTPYEWTNPHPCNADSDTVENQFSILNSLWFTIGALMQQGCEIAPQAISTRLVAGIWWFFTLIMISSYTANLAAFLTNERMVSDITSAEDLSKQTNIKYGTLVSGSTRKFFQNSKFPVYQKMYNIMENWGTDVYVNKSTEGIERVKEGGYAYFAESSSIEYVIERDCDLMQVGGWLDSKGYGIGLPRNSKYRDYISSAILKLQEDQDIQKLKQVWWKEMYGGGQCGDGGDQKVNSLSLGVKNVGGVFVVLVGGMVAGFLVAICEFIWKARKNAREDKQSLCSEMAEEFRFAIRCFGSSTKPLKRKPSNEVIDNGLQFMPLTGGNFGQNNVGREVYA